jgi:hypothetical protein
MEFAYVSKQKRGTRSGKVCIYSKTPSQLTDSLHRDAQSFVISPTDFELFFARGNHRSGAESGANICVWLNLGAGALHLNQ